MVRDVVISSYGRKDPESGCWRSQFACRHLGSMGWALHSGAKVLRWFRGLGTYHPPPPIAVHWASARQRWRLLSTRPVLPAVSPPVARQLSPNRPGT
ncbi:hypothetical protein NL676_022473 [Syzygium grande]|nr:hypothetical protein NL676_022473 [Syzygium grande]